MNQLNNKIEAMTIKVHEISKMKCEIDESIDVAQRALDEEKKKVDAALDNYLATGNNEFDNPRDVEML